MRRLGLLLAIAGSTLACASGPTPAPPVSHAGPADTWTAAPPTLGAAGDAHDWWREFQDPALDRLIEEVLVSNHDLAAAAARVEAAHAEARIAGADLAPSVGLGGDATRSRRNFIGFPIPGQDGGVASTTTTTLGVNLNLSWEVDVWGRLRATSSAATVRAAAAAIDLEGARLSLAGQAAKAWFAAAEARLQSELAESTLESRSSTRERIRRRYELGTREALDLRLAISAEAAARAAVAARQRQLDASRRQLELLLGRYPRATGTARESLTLAEPPRDAPGLLPAELVTRRPDLAAEELRLGAAGFDVHRARASLYPSLSLTGSSGRLSSDIEDLLDSDFSVWSLAANLLQPIFQGGRLRAGIDLAEARQRELAERYAQAVLSAFAEVELALAASESLELQRRALQEASEQAVAAQELAERRYDAGLADYLAVLASQIEATRAQTDLLAVQRQQLDARIDLHLALGGGFDTSNAPTS